MSKVFFGTFICRAQIHLKEVPDHLIRAQSYFLTERSIDSAVRELKDAIKLLEAAKTSYVSSNISRSASSSASSRSDASSSLS
jgi:hypothetical protein